MVKRHALADGSLCLLEGEAWRLEGDEWRDEKRHVLTPPTSTLTLTPLSRESARSPRRGGCS